MKRVLFIVVDALASRVVLPALDRGELPHLAQIIEHGVLAPESVAIFPSITPAATASLITGVYPSQHGIAGAYWYDRQENDVAYYGDDFWVVLKEGFGTFFDDFLVRLNNERLRHDTGFELVEKHGLKAACLNYLWFRGSTQHEAYTPLLLRLLPGVSSRKLIPGPQMLSLGDFVTSQEVKAAGDDSWLATEGGAFRRFGFSDATTADYLMQIAKADAFPDFTLAYFPDNDFESHSVGPEDALPVLKRFDETLGQLMDVYGGCAAMLEQMAIVITGDHSQCDLYDDVQAARISLDDVLSDYHLAAAGRPWDTDDELMVCPNMRAAQIYVRRDADVNRSRLVETLLGEQRIDQVIWFEGDDAPQYCVATADRGRLRFWRGEAGDSATDSYGTRWRWEGSLAAVDARLDEGKLTFADYPNAFERIAGGFFEISGDLWVTARPGCEFAVPETTTHPGGSHGSLHALDSLSPLIVGGLPATMEVPQQPRSVDVLPLCLQILGIDFELATGRVANSEVRR